MRQSMGDQLSVVIVKPIDTSFGGTRNFIDQSKADLNPAACVTRHHWVNVTHTDGSHKDHAGSNPSLHLTGKGSQDGLL